MFKVQSSKCSDASEPGGWRAEGEIDSINEIDAIDAMTDNEGLETEGRG